MVMVTVFIVWYFSKSTSNITFVGVYREEYNASRFCASNNKIIEESSTPDSGYYYSTPVTVKD